MNSKKSFMLITLGEELLLGLTANGHLTFVGEQLRKRGVSMKANFTISDEAEDIADYFSYCWERADVVITTGGLGPTVDDRTKEAISEVLGEALVFDDSILEMIQDRFASLGKKMTDNNKKQAYRPRSAEVLYNPNGTAPGLWLEKEGKVLIMLPGPPSELQPMILDQVLPKLEEIGYIEESENFIQLRTIGIGESALETRMAPLFEDYENLVVAYCAHHGQVDMRISFSDTEDHEALLEIAEECKRILGDDFLCFGHDSVAKVVSDILRSRDKSFAVAESCTGGQLSNAFTNIPGASKFFLGGIVCYSNDTKIDLLDVPEEMIQQHTAVSAEVAIAMASGVSEALEAEYTLSITGYAGPLGGDDDKPVGTLFIGLHTPTGIWSKRIRSFGTRQAIKTRAVNAALDWLRRELINEQDESSLADSHRDEAGKIVKFIPQN
ncbi:MAG: competence/damage-inducible protein A [Verrucomicrobiota bacterium]